MKLMPKKVAIVHDYLIDYGGAEKVLEALIDIYPNADVYTSIYKPNNLLDSINNKLNDDKFYFSGILSKLATKKYWKILIPFVQIYYLFLNLNRYDLVISSSSSFAKWCNTSNTKHLAYIHTPPRYLWNEESSTFSKLSSFNKLLLLPYLSITRIIEKHKVKTIDTLVANSRNISKKIKKYYDRKSKVIYPPVSIDITRENIDINMNDYFLVVNRLVAYKHIDAVIDAFNDSGKKLVIVGDGPEADNFKKLAESNITFTGFVDEDTKYKYFSGCTGFVYPGEEDFGISMVEAMHFGKPIIAYNGGGSKEIVSKETGVLFNKHTKRSINKAVIEAGDKDFDSEKIKDTAKLYSFNNFKKEILKLTYLDK